MTLDSANRDAWASVSAAHPTFKILGTHIDRHSKIWIRILIPGFNNLRTDMSRSWTDGAATWTLPAGKYDISALCARLQAAVAVTYATFTAVYDSVTNRVTFGETGGVLWNMTWPSVETAALYGFTGAVSVFDGTNPVTGTLGPRVFADYVYVCSSRIRNGVEGHSHNHAHELPGPIDQFATVFLENPSIMVNTVQVPGLGQENLLNDNQAIDTDHLDFRIADPQERTIEIDDNLVILLSYVPPDE